ncbi:hypothetical protein BKA70DRAFT_1428587 [Coprinopsis sp. MPI-PUGE-AT-0042]|nr:hypothetical protein BKA70DRAFT_1428587 [Coprinopsis sp. MPI-PUGE-AT-0042]
MGSDPNISGESVTENAAKADKEYTSPNVGMEDHKEYFWDVVRFKIGQTRFQLPIYRFIEESEYFATEYKLSDATKEGYAADALELDVLNAS